MGRPLIPIEERLNRFKLGGPTGTCWEWCGPVTNGGYGKLISQNKTQLAHRVAYSFHHPEEDILGKVIRHTCDNPLCINPEHLQSGSQHENIMDIVSRSRGIVGSLNGQAKLTEGDIIAIRESEKSGPELAKEFGISKSLVSRVRLRKCWRHIK